MVVSRCVFFFSSKERDSVTEFGHLGFLLIKVVVFEFLHKIWKNKLVLNRLIWMIERVGADGRNNVVTKGVPLSCGAWGTDNGFKLLDQSKVR